MAESATAGQGTRAPWTAAALPDLAGRTIVVTGANSGLGWETALELARKRATVVLACRNTESGTAAAARIAASVPGAAVEVLALDLASLASIRAFVDAFHARHRVLDVLINNAGVMALPHRTTADGFEMHVGTNHLGHFALTGLLADRLLAAARPRVVTVSAGFYRLGRIRLDDLHWQRRRYRSMLAYAQSKLANLLFTLELQRRADAAGAPLLSVASHPGYAATNLQFAGPRMRGSSVLGGLMSLSNRWFSQSAAMGALPTLYAAAAPEVRGGQYFGPDGFAELSGHPTVVGCNAAARDPEVARRLWEVSEQLTGVTYPALVRGAAAPVSGASH
ncbi:MAG TPA: oxidoreductase [Candidatus Binatia bacterium]|jgi:NAD(P)-dependent dehydrogenase (short-subunit alcohol dehydrogenase family)